MQVTKIFKFSVFLTLTGSCLVMEGVRGGKKKKKNQSFGLRSEF